MGIKAKIASLVVDLTANSASYNKELKKSKKETGAWANDVKKYAKVGAAAIVAAGASSAAGLAVLTAESMKSIDLLAKTSDKLGFATNKLAGYRHQAELNGMAQRSMDNSLQAMVRRVSEAADGMGTASKALKELGIDAKALESLSPDQQFSKIADEMGKVKNQSDKVKLSYQVFGREGIGMVNVMRGGSVAMAEAVKEAEQLGIAINRVDAAKIEAANDAAYRSDQVWKGLGNTLAINVSPFITAMKTDFVESSKEANGFRDYVATGMKVVSKSIGFAGNAVHGMRVVWKGTQLVVATFISETLTHLDSLSRGIVEFANLIPGINIELDPNSGIAGFAKVARNQVTKLKGELHDTAMQELPSDKVDKYFKKIQSEAQKAAEKIAALSSRKNTDDGVVDSSSSGSDVDRVAAELRAQNETTEQSYKRRKTIIDKALTAEQISKDRHAKLITNNWRKHQEELTLIDSIRAKAQIQTGKQIFGDLATLTQHGNKRLHSIGRASAKINIAIGTLEAAQNAYKQAAAWGGVYAGTIAATAATAAGWMRYRAVDSAGSGSGAGGLSGSTTFDQNLPDAAVSIDNIPGAAERRTAPALQVENYYAEGAVSAIDN